MLAPELDALVDVFHDGLQELLPACGAELTVKGRVQEPDRAADRAERHALGGQAEQPIGGQYLDRVQGDVAAVPVPTLRCREDHREVGGVDHSGHGVSPY